MDEKKLIDKPKRVEICQGCNSVDVHWECKSGAGDCYCNDCALDENYTCKTCGELLIPIED